MCWRCSKPKSYSQTQKAVYVSVLAVVGGEAIYGSRWLLSANLDHHLKTQRPAVPVMQRKTGSVVLLLFGRLRISMIISHHHYQESTSENLILIPAGTPPPAIYCSISISPSPALRARTRATTTSTDEPPRATPPRLPLLQLHCAPHDSVR